MSVREMDVEDATNYKVVVNHEEQYSIWPEWRDNPPGWRSVGVSGTKDQCLAHIDTVWTDMRPLSLRKAMERAALAPPADAEPEPTEPEEESLPVRLSRGTHPVELILRPAQTAETLTQQIETGYLQVKFTATRGGTELSVPLAPDAITHMKAQLARGESLLRVRGRLTLDYVPVRCVADIDLTTFTGTGHLEIAGA